MIKTGCVYSEPQADGGLRVLVTRYWPRGVKKEKADIWMRELGPKPELIKAWKSGGISRDAFRKEYLKEFGEEEKKEKLSELKAIARKHGDIILLCTCKEEDQCHRGILKGLAQGKKNPEFKAR